VSKLRIGNALLVVALLSILWIAPAQAQGGGWSEPYRLSTDAGKASEASLVTDQYGYVHCFWTETLFDSETALLQYARFDGGTWSAPVDLFVARYGISGISPAVDKHGTLHIVWTEGILGPVYYTYAPAFDGLSVRNWAEPVRIGLPAGILRFRIDSKDVFHMLYVNRTEELGVYYVRSMDQGTTWTEPLWLDPDITPGRTPDSLNFELDENDGLHAVWFYGALDRELRADWVRYIHSLDGGETWSSPFMIDQYVEDTQHNLTSASPVMTVQGTNVHVVWAAGPLPYRNYRFSADAGLTWSEPVRILGELHGQAFDGLAVDGAGRVHFVGQIRYPFGIYDAYWDRSRWSKPSLVYFIAQAGTEEEFVNRVHAHYTYPIVRAGNQLIVTFSDPPTEPNRRLFVTFRTLDDIAPLETIPTPTAQATLIAPPSPTSTQSGPAPTATTASNYVIVDEPLEETPRPGLALQVGIVPVLLILAGALIFRLWYKARP
jgi:hypothetical protein